MAPKKPAPKGTDPVKDAATARVVLLDDGSFLGRVAPEKSIKFVLVGCHLELANALRRVILAEVVTVAPKYDQYNQEDPTKNDVIVTVNTTALHDQIMGHRISMLPIHMSAVQIADHERSHLKFVIDSTNSQDLPMDVTTKDVKIYDADGSPLPAARRATFLPPDPFTGDYPIVARLKPSEVLKAEFYARRGVARENARWAAASTCAFAFVVDEDIAEADLSARLAKAASDADAKDVREHHASIDRQRCFEVDDLGDPLKVSLHVESECGLSAADVVLSAFDVLLGKIDALRTKLRVEGAHPDDPAFFNLSLSDEDHTMGNMYQALCFRFYPDELDYVGYMMPHPLQRNIVFKIKLGAAASSIEDFLEKSIADIRAHVSKVKQLFSEAVGMS